MEDQDQSPHPSYLKGFNEGYTMTKYMPDLAKEIAAAVKDTERGNGFKDGNDQYVLDAERDAQMPDWLKETPEASDTPSLHSDKEDVEPEL